MTTGAQGHTSLLEAVMDNLDEGVVTVDAQGRLQLINAAARGLLGLDVSDVGRRLEDAVTDYRLVIAVRSCIVDCRPVERELTGPSQTRVVNVRVVPIDAKHGSTAGAVLVLRNDSRLRHLETARRDFVANISHELRTPITAIQLLVETLQKGAIDDPESASGFITRIAAEVTHMSQMVAELLQLGAIESGTGTMQFAPVSPTEMAVAAERLRPLAEQRGVDLSFEVDPRTPAVLGDAAHLGQVMRNLVHNAIKFTPRGGSVRVGIHPIDADDARVRLEVVDTGCGLSADEAARVFERFYKVDRSRQRDGEGTGLGLAIVRHVVEAHGGLVRVLSEPGRGSTFSVILPAARQDASG